MPTRRKLTVKPRTSDAELVRGCLAGDESAWREIVHRFSPLVYSIPRRLGLSDPDVEDVFQGVFMILYRKLDTIRDADQLAAWLIQTTNRESYRVVRRSRPSADLDPSTADESEPVDDQLETWERRHQIGVALRRLGGTCESLLRELFLSTGRPDYKVIAARLGMKVGSIGPTRSRCFTKLEKILDDLGYRDE